MCLLDSFICSPAFVPNPSVSSVHHFLKQILLLMIYIWTFCLSAMKYHRRCQYTTCHSFGDIANTTKSNAKRSKEWSNWKCGEREKAFSFCLQEKLMRNLITLNMKVCEYHVVWRQTVTQYWRAARIYIWHNIILKMTCVNVSVSTVIYWISIRLVVWAAGIKMKK